MEYSSSRKLANCSRVPLCSVYLNLIIIRLPYSFTFSTEARVTLSELCWEYHDFPIFNSRTPNQTRLQTVKGRHYHVGRGKDSRVRTRSPQRKVTSLLTLGMLWSTNSCERRNGPPGQATHPLILFTAPCPFVEGPAVPTLPSSVTFDYRTPE